MKGLMNRQRGANLFWLIALVYVLFYVGGQASSLITGLWPSYPKEIETPADPYAQLSLVQIGQRIFEKQGCQSCHQVDLIGGTLGPALSNVGVRRSEAWLQQQLLDPQEAVPGNYMPSYAYLSQLERDSLVAYMRSLNQDRQGLDTGHGDVPQALLDAVPLPRRDGALIEHGRQLFASNGCTACHMINGQGGTIGPNLTREGLRHRSDEWQKQHLKDPLSVYMDGPTAGIQWPMPGFARLAEAELDALVAYLQSLR